MEPRGGFEEQVDVGRQEKRRTNKRQKNKHGYIIQATMKRREVGKVPTSTVVIACEPNTMNYLHQICVSVWIQTLDIPRMRYIKKCYITIKPSWQFLPHLFYYK